MNQYDACEHAYQNGREEGYAEALREAGVHIVDGCGCVSNAKVSDLKIVSGERNFQCQQKWTL